MPVIKTEPFWRQEGFARSLWLPGIATLGLAVGGILWISTPLWGHRLWLAVLIATGSIVVWRTVRDAIHGRWAADIIASLSIATAAVMDQPLPGLIVVIMQTGGEALERFAEGRASDAVRALEADRPEHAHVRRDESTVDIPANDVVVGDIIIVRPGELIPCDGIVTQGTAQVDTSRLTGEPLPVSIAPGSSVSSGGINGSRPFVMRATAVAAESQYARIVELVRTAQATKAPFQRMADRYAIWFTPLTLVVAGIAAILSGDSTRVLAVLVVATPCPLILAPPIAVIGGINRAARQYIILRSGTVMERLGHVDVAVFDKTGTLTIGKPTVADVHPLPPFTRNTLLTLAAAIEQGSSHLLARSLVDAAIAEHNILPAPRDIAEEAGRGVTGIVDNDHIAVGSHSFLRSHLDEDGIKSLDAASTDGLRAYVAINRAFAGFITYADQIRPGVKQVLTELGTLGIHRLVLLSGDHETSAQAVADVVGIREVHGDLMPEGKVDAIHALNAQHHEVLMVGDGTNDAPALSTAAVGVALAGHGGGVTAEAADVVVLIDDLSRVPKAIRISKRTMRIAQQSMWAGLLFSGVAMGFAAAGYIAPTAGAILQEVIDVAVILNALRASSASS